MQHSGYPWNVTAAQENGGIYMGQDPGAHSQLLIHSRAGDFSQMGNFIFQLQKAEREFLLRLCN